MMNNLRSITAAIALSAALAAPAFAQTSTAPANNPPVASPTGSTTASSSSDNGSSNGSSTANSTYMTADKDVRASKVIGASVYNDHDQKIGTVDELLMDTNHDVTQAVLSVGGFLGVDSKLVAVKIDRLSVKPDRIVMAGATKDGLTRMPTYTFSKS
jgi:sporulation protein YlmC with PRC-barrel domain